MLLIKNAKIITPYEILEGCSIIVENDKIKEIVEDAAMKGRFTEVVDAEGRYAAPGFIDIHNHGSSGHDVMEATFEALDAISQFHCRNGVTGFLAAVMTASGKEIRTALKNAADYMAEKNRSHARVLGIYLEGPYFSVEKKGAQPAAHVKSPDLEELKELLGTCAGSIKVVSLAPELENAQETIGFLRDRKITAALGHTNATYRDATLAIRNGATLATHLFNGMREFTHREPGVIGAVFSDERVMCEIICDGIHLHRAAMQMAVKAKGAANIVLISDSMMAAGLEDGDYFLGGQKVFVREGAARLSDGTLAGSTLTLDRAVYNMIRLTGVPLKDAVRMATLNPARCIGIDRRKGSIEAGKDADLILFDEQIKVSGVMIGGQIL